MIPVAVAAVLGAGLLLSAGPPSAWPRDASSGRHPRRPSARPGPLDVARLVERIATVVGSGVAPRAAWAAVASTTGAGPLRDLARAVGAGADPRRAAPARLARSGEVAALGAALALCERTGAPAGPVLLTLADALRAVADAGLARRSAFAGPLATARILLALPVLGIGLGMLLGADPLGLLLTGGGRLLGVLGVALTAAGWWWMRSLVRSAREEPAAGAVDPSIVLDLVAGPLAAGAPLAAALVAVADALEDDEAASSLEHAGTALGAGAPVAIALAGSGPALEPLREAALVGETTGADPVGLLRSNAADARRGRAREAEAAAARLAVRLVLPTGATLLPAFVLLGIVPTVASLLGGSFSQVLP
ncbi:type II secretion system F family protein [Brachybacterium huguangmaarense]|uniref:Type II secretion system F family protein n=1 Tax=Brachybacterium huguangmaarense TaxID=1652028 RepID=A0ABY6G453_9MICO|nr:type II secretion system F family protein [Brachybacterium huguangmaarense]UYG17978.1 type II secretion system F family protein [Brachybacterium huguangmaarense]